VKVTVDVLGDTIISRRLVRWAENAGDLSDAFDTILDEFEVWWEAQFETRGATFGTPWQPLASSTIAAKTAAGYSDPEQPLVATGALRASGGSVRHVGAQEAVWGTDDPNAMWHHGRARSSGNRVPRRPLFEPDELKRRWMMDVLHRHLFETGALR
jgi:hypothetical protein